MTDATRADTNPLWLGWKRHHLTNIVGIGNTPKTLTLYQQRIEEYSQEIYDNPAVLDDFQLSLKSTFKSVAHIPKKRNELTWREKYMYWRANPWIAAWDLIGQRALIKTQAAGAEPFSKFTIKQRQFMRDFCDPRKNEMAIRCCRGGAKTFIIAVCVAIMEFLVPRLRVTINSGSAEQSDALYTYYKVFVTKDEKTDTVLHRGLLKDPLKTKADYIHGGWVHSLTASEKQSRGPRPDILIIDEECQALEVHIKAAMGGTWTATKLKIVHSSTPNKMNSMFYKIQKDTNPWPEDWVEGAEPILCQLSKSDCWVYHWNCYEVDWISDVNIQKAKDRYDRNEFRVEMMGDFGSASGTVFDHDDIEASKVLKYDMKKVLKSLIDKSLGVDWGWAHKTGVIVCGVDKDDMMHVIYAKASDHLKEKQWTEDIIPAVVRRYDPSTAGGDSEGGFQNKSLDDELEEFGLDVSPIAFKKYKQKMISALRSRFEHRMIKFYCGWEEIDELIEQLFGYEYDKTLAGEVSELPAKGNDDYIDGLLIAAYPLRLGQTILDETEEEEVATAQDMFGYDNDDLDIYRGL